jgi:hypothetical protein
MCGFTYYYELSLSIAVIEKLGTLPYSLADVVRRLVLIISSIIIFGNPVSIVNASGILTALTGVLAYNISRNQKAHNGRSERAGSSPRRE